MVRMVRVVRGIPLMAKEMLGVEKKNTNHLDTGEMHQDVKAR